MGFVAYPFLLASLWHDPGFVNTPWMYFAFLGNFDVISWHEQGYAMLVNRVLSNTWSISIEEQFYFVWPVILVFARGKLFPVLCAFFMILSGWFALAYSDYLGVYFHSLGTLFYLASGALLAWLTFYSETVKTWFANLGHRRSLAIMVPALILLIFRDDVSDSSVWHEATNLFAAVFFAFVIGDQCFNRRPFYSVGKLKLLSAFGKYTYSWYLLHIVVILVGNDVFHYLNWFRDGITNEVLKALIVIPGSLILAVLSYHLIERPFLKLKGRLKAS
jgi:peptidoglycan/LPS O-acetylase OafA/YrhL